MENNNLKLLALIFEGRMYKVVIEPRDEKVSKYDKILSLANVIIDLQTRKFVKSRYSDVETITESNPFYHILMNLQLITIHQLYEREPQLFL